MPEDDLFAWWINQILSIFGLVENKKTHRFKQLQAGSGEWENLPVDAF